MIRIPESFGIGNSAQGSWNPGSTDKKSGPIQLSKTVFDDLIHGATQYNSRR